MRKTKKQKIREQLELSFEDNKPSNTTAIETQDSNTDLSEAINKSKLKERACGHNKKPSGVFFDNRIGLITVEELAVIFGLAPQTIRNWVAKGKLPYAKIGRRNMFLVRSVQEWLNRKEEPQWQ